MPDKVKDLMPMAKMLGRGFAYRSGMDVDDCISEAYLALVVADRDYRGPTKDFVRYASQAVKHQLLNARRKLHPEQSDLIDYPTPDAMNSILGRECWDVMVSADPMGAKLWYAVNVDGLSVGAAGTECGISWKSAKNKISIVDRALAQMLQENAEK